jgi:hypothetical protein
VLVVELEDDDVLDPGVVLVVDPVGPQPLTQNTLCLVSAPIEPWAFAVNRTCQPCRGVALDPGQRPGQVVGLAGVEVGATTGGVPADVDLVGDGRRTARRRP